ncbi:hypothetical protein [Nocardia transvalensis]|uniref:hypothetical protein n=1 Tax=Nocardia transvalensis TaxID=37333 RepID=UPI001894A294|nr:hypothetical protein [Nocardia transvalensis]MBF6331345.1 hypothetical protein [Nocardia transvalensis]
MKRIAMGVAGACVAASALGVAAAGSATAAVPAGVYCAGPVCFNSTAEPQIVAGVAICPLTGPLPVTWRIEPRSVASLTTQCSDGSAPREIQF